MNERLLLSSVWFSFLCFVLTRHDVPPRLLHAFCETVTCILIRNAHLGNSSVLTSQHHATRQWSHIHYSLQHESLRKSACHPVIFSGDAPWRQVVTEGYSSQCSCWIFPSSSRETRNSASESLFTVSFYNPGKTAEFPSFMSYQSWLVNWAWIAMSQIEHGVWRSMIQAWRTVSGSMNTNFNDNNMSDDLITEQAVISLKYQTLPR